MNKKAIICYHRVDFDGVFSGCIVKNWLENNHPETEIEMMPFTYGDPVPVMEEKEFDEIFIVDISFPAKTMKWLKSNVDVCWIDHHITAIKQSETNGYSDLDGIRQVGTAACELCWKFFYKDKVPQAIEYLGCYDVWDHSRYDWDIEVVPFQLSLKATYGMSFDQIYGDFDNLMTLGVGMNPILEAGRKISQYESRQFASAVKTYAFPVKVADKFNGIAMLTNSMGSRIFDSVKNDYDVYVTANRRTDDNGNVYFTAGLYAEQGRIDFNLGEYVQSKFGADRAGGHQFSCGTTLTKEEFMELVMEGRI